MPTPYVLQLHLEFFDMEDVCHPHRGMAVDQRELDARLGEMLPDKLQHQQLVEVRIEQGPDHRVKLPVVVVRAFCKIDDHRRESGPHEQSRGKQPQDDGLENGSLEHKGYKSGLSSFPPQAWTLVLFPPVENEP